MSMATKSDDFNDWITGANLQMEGCASHYQVAKRALKKQGHWAALHPFHHPGLQGGNHHLVAPGPSIV